MCFRVSDAMATNVVCVHPTTTIDDACARLLQHRVSGLPVVDDSMSLIGIVTEKDLLCLFSDTCGQQHTVAQYMRTDLITITEECRLTDIAEKFRDSGIRRFPVVREGKLIGVLSRRDLIRFITELRQRVSSELEMGRRMDFRTQRDIAEFCRVSRSTVQKLVRSGKLPGKERGSYHVTKRQLAQLSELGGHTEPVAS